MFARKSKILITDVVLTEILWILKGKKYKLSKDNLLGVVDQLFKEPGVIFEDGQTVWRALHDLRETGPIKVGSKRKDADFADALILEKSRYYCAKSNNEFKGLFFLILQRNKLKVLNLLNKLK